MKRSIIISVLSLILCVVVIFSVFTEAKYDLSPVQYIKYSLPYTAEEQAFIKQHKYLDYGLDKNAAPLTFVEKNSGTPSGLTVDYMSSFSINSGIMVRYHAYNWNRCVKNLRSGKIDVVDMFPTKQRKKYFDFTQSIYTINGVIVIRHDTKEIKTGSDLIGRNVAVIRSDYAEEYMKYQFPDTNGGSCRLTEVANIKEGLALVESGKADAFIADAPVVDYYLKRTNSYDAFKVLDSIVYSGDVSFAVKKGNTILLNVMNKTILHLKRQNTLNKAQEKWFGNASPTIKHGNYYDIGLFITLAILILIIIITLWNTQMKRKITEKTAELEANRKYLRAIIDTLSSCLLLIDSDRMIVGWNRTSAELLGLQGKQNRIDDDPLLRTLYDAPADEPQQFFEGHYYETSRRDLESQDTTLFVFSDITSKVVSERRSMQENKMIAVGHLTAGLAHEIRNPLGLVRSYLYIIRTSKDPEVIQKSVSDAEKSIDRINSLITKLLSFSKQESTGSTKVNVQILINDILSLEKKSIEKKNARVTLTSENQPLVLNTDPESLKIIIINLIENAIEAFDPNSKGNEIHVDTQYEQQNLRLSISDNGAGMDPETVENIFIPFFTTKDTGIGLGLYIVHNELDKIGAAIHVSSKKGVGTEFVIDIPTEKNNREPKGEA